MYCTGCSNYSCLWKITENTVGSSILTERCMNIVVTHSVKEAQKWVIPSLKGCTFERAKSQMPPKSIEDMYKSCNTSHTIWVRFNWASNNCGEIMGLCELIFFGWSYFNMFIITIAMWVLGKLSDYTVASKVNLIAWRHDMETFSALQAVCVCVCCCCCCFCFCLGGDTPHKRSVLLCCWAVMCHKQQ